jgi:serine protease Do
VNNWRNRLAAAVIAAASIGAWTVHGANSAAPSAPVAVSAAAPTGADARIVGAGLDSYAAIVDKVAPAVVTVRSERRARAAQQFPFAQDPFFRRFFPDGESQQQPPRERRQGGLGSGVIVSADGYMLTNHHVVDGAEEITVDFTDGRSFTAKVIGTDAPSDLAVL